MKLWIKLLLMKSIILCTFQLNTVDVEKFAGLNIRGFNPIEVSMEILSCGLGKKCFVFSTCIIKERY